MGVSVPPAGVGGLETGAVEPGAAGAGAGVCTGTGVAAVLALMLGRRAVEAGGMWSDALCERESLCEYCVGMPTG